MASSKVYSTRPKHNFLHHHTDHHHQPLSNDSLFEFDESDIWNTTTTVTTAARALSPVTGRRPTAARGAGPASLPMNVPDWSKILKGEYRENRQENDDFDDFEESKTSDRVPPHEFLAKSRFVSLSVHEGIGRTLKGRDLSRVRNAIWQKTGFED